MSRRKRGKARELVLKALEGKKGQKIEKTLFEICKYLNPSKPEHAKKTVFEHLKKLEKEGLVEQVFKRGPWRLTDSCIQVLERRVLSEIVREPLAVYLSPIGFLQTPYFELGHSPRISDWLEPPPGLYEATFRRFRPEIEALLFKMSERKIKSILGFAARCLWLGYTDWSVEKARFGSLEELVREKIGNWEGEKELAEFLAQGFRDNVKGGPRPLPDYKLYLLAHALLEDLTRKINVEKIPVDEGENVEWLSQHEKNFRAFAREVEKIRFAYILTVGFKEVEELWEKNLRNRLSIERFERWLKDLKEGRYDEFPLELERNRRALGNTIRRIKLKRELEPREDVTDPRWVWRGWTPRDLYLHHPRGRYPEFYLEICREIRKRLEVGQKLGS